MKRSRLRPVSEKRRAENVERQKLMLEKFGPREERRCAAHSYAPTPYSAESLGDCRGDVNGHELVKRSAGGSITDMDNVILLCNFHNGWVEDHPATAHFLGLAAHNWE